MAKKKEEVNLNEIDASFVISSFKNKERRNNPSSIPKALVPEHEKEKEQETEPEETPQPVIAIQVETPREETKRKRSKAPDYEDLFIQEAEITARTGKSVYIRKEHHDKIVKIVQVIAKNQVSLFSYIDNVLKHHFETFQDEITELYNKNNESIF
jgi:TorA maturation chaperone TorD